MKNRLAGSLHQSSLSSVQTHTTRRLILRLSLRFHWPRGGSVSADPIRYSIHSIASGLGPVCVAKGTNPRKHRRPVQKGADDQEIIPARPRPVEKVYEQPTIYTNPRDPDSIINTKPLDTVFHREKDFSIPIVSYIESSEPHIRRMYQ